MEPNNPTNSIRRQRHSVTKKSTIVGRENQQIKPTSADGTDSDDDLEVDLAKAALETGTTAFDTQQWTEAESLLREALRALGQLPKEKRGFCDVFDLHFKLSVCAYYTQTLPFAEQALTSLSQHSLATDAHRASMCEATHLLAQLYIRMGRIDLAKSECERTLQARRRLFGKRSDGSLESMVLMAHIFVLLENRALAKTYLAMVPEEKREGIMKRVAFSLGTSMGHLEFSTVMQQQVPEYPAHLIDKTRIESTNPPVNPISDQDRMQHVPVATYSPTPSRSSIATSPVSPPRWSPHPHEEVSSELRQMTWSASPSSASATFDNTTSLNRISAGTQASTVSASMTEHHQSNIAESMEQKNLGEPLPRRLILEKVGCQPRDNIEEAVCKGDHLALTKLLDKKKGFWRSSIRRNMKSERVTALHFAALFGEVDMARRLIAASYNINEIPFGYSTRLTPLHFAIGARQVNMVQFLTANGARPVEPDTWSTFASQVMARSWILKTMSDTDRDSVPGRMVAIFDILLNNGWQINTPYESAGNTVLHQAVAFWTGSYRLDLEVRNAVTLFLCTKGADPLRKNNEGKTPWDIAVGENHQDLLWILKQGANAMSADTQNNEPAELPANC